MENYFTLVKTMIGSRKCGVAVMGTARGRYVLDNKCVYIVRNTKLHYENIKL